MNLTPELKKGLIKIALDSIEYGIKNHLKYIPDLKLLPDLYKQPAATFVTILKKGKLNGCIGSLKARNAMAMDVASNAFDAAFNDGRFNPVESMEELTIEISILSKPQKMEFKSEQDLLNKIRENSDGIIIKYGIRQATFLPSVWESLADKKSFLGHLKIKAGLAPDFWSENMEVFRYTAEKIRCDE